MFALLGSLLYLLGTACSIGDYGTLDIACCQAVAQGRPPHAALGLMIAGLLAKAALFPLHLWLPPAHAGAPAAASAVLSALVVKAPFFLLLRLCVRCRCPAGGRICIRSARRPRCFSPSCSAASWRCGRRA